MNLNKKSAAWIPGILAYGVVVFFLTLDEGETSLQLIHRTLAGFGISFTDCKRWTSKERPFGISKHQWACRLHAGVETG